jgi:hypothetical protein
MIFQQNAAPLDIKSITLKTKEGMKSTTFPV